MIHHINILILTPLCSNKDSLIVLLELRKLGPFSLVDIEYQQGLAYKVVYDGKVALIDEVLEIYGELAGLLIGT